MTKLATSIALHSLSLAVTGKMVGTTALVAGRMARTTGETTASVATKTATTDGCTTAHVHAGGVGARPCEVTRLSAVVAAAIATSSTTVQAESWAVCLDVAQALAVVALLSLRRPRKRALVRLVAFSSKLVSCVNSVSHQVKQDLPGCLQL